MIQAHRLIDRLLVCVCVFVWVREHDHPAKISSVLLIFGLISVAGSETDIKWNRLPKSSFIDYTGPHHRGRGVGDRSDGRMNRIGDKTGAGDGDKGKR